MAACSLQVFTNMLITLKRPYKRWTALWTLLLGVSVLAACIETATPDVVAKRVVPLEKAQVEQAEKVSAILTEESQGISRGVQRELVRTIMALSERHGIDPMMILAIIRTESSFRPEIKSYAGAIGLMQIKPIVVKDVADELPLYSRPAAELLRDPVANLHIGVYYLKTLQERFGGENWYHVLAAYNMGPTYVGKLLRRKKRPSDRYYSKVMQNYRHYSRMTLSQPI